MAMGTERSRSLHNFTMPSGLRWGNQRFLRCMKVKSNGQISALQRFAADTDQRHQHPIQQRRTTRDGDGDGDGGLIDSAASEFSNGSPKVSPTTAAESDGSRRFENSDEGIAAIREKVMFDLQTAADKIKDAIFKDGLEEGKVSISSQLPPPPPPPPLPLPPSDGEVHRPWNLRTRRAASKASASGIVSGRNDVASASASATASAAAAGGSILKLDLSRPNSATAAAPPPAYKSPINKIHASEATASGGKRTRPKFSVALTKRDIEEDFFAMVGHRPPRRPKKRAKIVQKELDCLFPGLWLNEVTPDMYKVHETTQ